MSLYDDELRPDEEAARVICDEELIHIEIKELNKRIKDKGVSKELASRLKQRRRTLKNRKYATSLREKKDAEISTLEIKRDLERQELRDLEQESDMIRERVQTMTQQYNRILEFAHENNLDVNTGDIDFPLSPEGRSSE